MRDVPRGAFGAVDGLTCCRCRAARARPAQQVTGFAQAFSSIVDGHLTTLISCAALFFLGTGLVKGFAATLGIGVLLSLFTALTCTRTLLRFLMGYAGLRTPSNFLPMRQLSPPSA